MRLHELPGNLRARGLTVREVAGWETRGTEFARRPSVVLKHWTAGPIAGLAPSLRVCTFGRQGLSGPLCQVFQSREVDGNGLDVVYVIASGIANHAGLGSWRGISGNSRSTGLEIEWAGPSEPYHGVRRRYETSTRVLRAMLDASSDRDAQYVCLHREWAPNRKIDTNDNGNTVRADVAALDEGDDDMSQADVDHIKAQVDAIAGELFHYDEIKEPVPETGQRKSQMWHLLNLPGQANATNMYAGGLHRIVTALVVRQDPELAEALGLTMPEDIAAKLPDSK